MQSNGSYQKQIKSQLSILERLVKDAEETQQNEPETRVKKTVHRTYATKFRDLLRTSQTIQTEFKNAVQSRIKRQLKVYVPNATEAELDKLAKDPQAAANFQNEQILGRVGAHSKIKNTVNDIQEKYEAIKKLEQVSFVKC